MTNIKENYKNYTACPETLGQAINHLHYFLKKVLAWTIYRLRPKYSLKGLENALEIDGGPCIEVQLADGKLKVVNKFVYLVIILVQVEVVSSSDGENLENY